MTEPSRPTRYLTPADLGWEPTLTSKEQDAIVAERRARQHLTPEQVEALTETVAQVRLARIKREAGLG